MSTLDLESLKTAILEYREIGKILMSKLANYYGYNIEILEEYEELIWRGNKSVARKESISNRWNYTFHGGQCKFYNKKHQQTIEVELTNPPDFGKLDAWFVMNYLESTDKFKKLVENMDWLEIKKMIQELYDSGEIQKI